MFTVKATYRGETRKFTFAECNSFPSFQEIYNNLYRVFPISHNFYLSKLLFSPDSSRSRILIGQEVHSAEEYNNYTSRYSVGHWPNPLLKFSVFDETPHKLPNSPAVFNLPQPWPQRSIEVSAAQQPQNPFGTPPSTRPGSNSSPFNTISFSHIPPPPIIFPPIRSSPQVPMDVDQTQLTKFSPSPQSLVDSKPEAEKPSACCAATQRKEEVKVLINDLKSELERIVSDLNDMASKEVPRPSPSAPVFPSVPTADVPPPLPPKPIFPSLCQFNFCWKCGVIKQGPWYHCGKCDNKICVNCYDAGMDSNCLVATGPHVWNKMFCANCPDTQQPSQPEMTPWGSTSVNLLDNHEPLVGLSNQPPVSSPTLLTLPSVPTSEPRVVEGESSNMESAAQMTGPAEVPPRNDIHYGVGCDVCHSVIEGVRHKCLDCADYDLCTGCITTGSAERHNPFHEFIEINEPGRVIVHTVLSGSEDRDAARQPPPVQAEPALHSATCDLCDSRIRGDRYKCVDCPDFDTCQSCFSITREQHPHHAFVKLSKPEDFIRRRESEPPIHFATCNICTKTICGVRYKCMHADCPDFDLCENCEAHPIAVHPRNHPLLKMKDASTTVPCLRVEQPIPVPVPAPAHESNQNSFRNSLPSLSENRNAVEDLYQPPSPFFFRTETGGSNSPIEHHNVNRAVTPPSAFYSPQPTPSPPPSPPMTIPGALPGTFNLPVFTPTSPISPSLHPQDEPRNRSPSPAPLTPLWKHMSLPPIPSYNLTPTPPAPQLSSWNVEDNRQLTEEMAESVRHNFLSSQMNSRLPPRRSDSDFSFGRLAIRDPSPAFGRWPLPRTPSPQPPVDRSQSPRQSRDWRQTFCFDSFQDRQHQEVYRPPVGPAQQPHFHTEERLPSLRAMFEPFSDGSDSHTKAEQSVTLPPLQSTVSSGLWPENFQEMRHLMDGMPNFDREFRSFFDDSKPVTTENSMAPTPAPQETPLGRESLLNSPPPAERVVRTEDAARSLASILTNQPEPKQTFVEDRAEAEAAFPELPDLNRSTAQVADSEVLNAEFVADRSVPDGQEFPPGAEFMKSWSMVNTGKRAWPEETELVFVAGEDLSLPGKSEPVKVGAVQPGESVDLWTGELKAPDVSGRYVGYYRLRDATGHLFGHSIWLDITVSETFHRGGSSADSTTSEGYSSLSSSSMIVMPKSAPSVPSLTLASQRPGGNTPGSSMPGSPVTAPSSRSDVDVDVISNAGSDASSVSLVSMPSSQSEDEDEELYRDCRQSIHVAASTQTLRAPEGQNQHQHQHQQVDEYVVLYDEATSSEEE